MTQLFLPDELERDLKRILELDDAALGKIAELMDTEAGIGGTLSVARRFAQHAEVPPYVASLAVQVARYLARQKRECELDEAGVIDELVAAFPKLAPLLNRRRQVLTALLSGKPQAERLRKKERLSHGIVKTLVGVDGYCDLRPVFDADRKEIVDQVRVVLARLQLEDETGDEETVVLQLNDESLKKLDEFLVVTKRKLACLSAKYVGQ
jgi:hypothetical protein